jgi:hypothetical protein
MCRRVDCRKCGRPTFAGCGAHVEQVLGDVPPADRCRCREEAPKEAEASAATSPGSRLRALFGKWLIVALGLGLTAGGAVAFAHPAGGTHACPGMGTEHGGGMGGGHGADMMGVHFLFAHRDAIKRTVTEIPGGVRTVTETDEPEVAAQLQEHVQAMYARLKDGRPINTRDPLFAALFRNADRIDVRIEKTAKGLRVTETSADPAVVKLIRRHAEVVSLFLANGMQEMMRSH